MITVLSFATTLRSDKVSLWPSRLFWAPQGSPRWHIALHYTISVVLQAWTPPAADPSF